MTDRQRAALIEARRILREYGVNYLLADPSSNPKLAKSLKLRVLSAPLHLAPASLSGFNTCPMATNGCRAACLHTAGNPVYMAAKQKARIARTRAYFGARAAFMTVLCGEIERHKSEARRRRMRCAVRLNATSDIRFERVPVTWYGETYPNVMAAFPSVTFYDYTKIANRRDLPPNYTLTFSLAENNERHAVTALKNGLNVAAVFGVGRNAPLPEKYKIGEQIVRVIDGDAHDYRPADPRGVIVGLRAKGKARDNASGFVRKALSF